MSKHEEARKKLLFSPLKINNGLIVGDLFKFISDYIAEQEKKDELLGLYREKDNHINNWENYDRSCDMGYIAKLEYLQEQIKLLEEELK